MIYFITKTSQLILLLDLDCFASLAKTKSLLFVLARNAAAKQSVKFCYKGDKA